MNVPTRPLPLMTIVYKRVIPIVHKELAYWKQRAEEIPDAELRKQALASISTKTFHCEGGAIMAILAGKHINECIRFIVAYQTISDYLDNLCDRSNSLDPNDFRALHESMPQALNFGEKVNYYRERDDQNDGGYLHELVQTCQDVLKKVVHYDKISEHIIELANFYCDLQVHKHVHIEKRVERLENWFSGHKDKLPDMTWYEFSACAGSTLGIFCLVSYSFNDEFSEEMLLKLKKGYFPYIQGLHILLDYFIDQDEDQIGGDLNFCFFYENEKEMEKRLIHFVEQADKHINGLPNEEFHRLINRGLLGIYLSDEKMKRHKQSHLAKRMVRLGGKTTRFFYLNGKLYRGMQRLLKFSTGNLQNKGLTS
ncbi:tetraprenyl-beta-curcumene synthase family protein [Bacillus timonensis]|nr:tetraprenyl-beta-curcumene synthase family protein [Bacillus timonensis]